MLRGERAPGARVVGAARKTLGKQSARGGGACGGRSPLLASQSWGKSRNLEAGPRLSPAAVCTAARFTAPLALGSEERVINFPW